MGLERDAISMEAFCDAIFAGASHSGDVWSHFLGWLDRREETKSEERVLTVSFEEMKRDLRAVARRVGRFLKTQPEDHELTESDLDFVTRMSGFERMRADAARFDDHFVRRKMWARVGIPESDWRGAGSGRCARAGAWAGARGSGVRAREDHGEVGADHGPRVSRRTRTPPRRRVLWGVFGIAASARVHRNAFL